MEPNGSGVVAVAATDHGRERMIPISFGPPPPVPLGGSCARSSVARFWDLPSDFVSLRYAPASRGRAPFTYLPLHRP